MIKKIIYFFGFLTCSYSVFAQTLASYVNPFIGTGGTGHTFPGAVMPFGMVQLSPDTRIDGSWEGCSGYHYSDSVIYGFTHTHLSGTGVSDYGDILVMPTLNNNTFKNKAYATSFNHRDEKASAGYYEVTLSNGIQAQFTTTQRVGIHQYHFPKDKDTASILLDLLHRDVVLDNHLQILDSVTISGYRISEAWAREQYVYFVMKFNKPILASKMIKEGLSNKAQVAGAFIQFKNNNHSPLLIKVGVSQTSEASALLNLTSEAPHWDFNTYRQQAEEAWNKELSKIKIKTNNHQQLTTFYTALYHCFTHPSLAGDVDGKYRGRDLKVHQAKGFTPYTVFSLWDTYRGLHPLLSIIDQKRTVDFIQSFIQQDKESGRLPMWELSANETNCMIGFHSVSVITDAITKNIKGFNIEEAYNAMRAASNYTSWSIPTFNKNLGLQIDDEHESVSKTLEYAYDNWCIAQIAKQLNKPQDYKTHIERAQAYKNVFDKETGFMRPRKNGNWLSPFEPREVNNHYTEANSWQYTFYVPQDVDGLTQLMGGAKKLEEKLDALFNASNKTVGREQVDITGLIGQYAHGNEPSHHMAYLYNYIGKPEKAQEKIYKILNEFYHNQPDGLIGNEDCGQMSAWYVLSALGFYPVCPGKPEYIIGSPLFDEATIYLENQHTFTIKKRNPENRFQYIQNSFVNGKASNSTVLLHQTIMAGGSLEFVMSNNPQNNGAFGKSKALMPQSSINESLIVQTPIIIAPSKITENNRTIQIHSDEPNAKIFYTTDNTEPTSQSKLYTQAFTSDTSVTIKAIAVVNNKQSATNIAKLYKKPNQWKIKLESVYNPQYDAEGEDGIIDGKRGTTNWRSGGWQGYQGQDFVCVIDLGKETDIHTIVSNYLQDTRSWIIYPTQVEYFVSTDGKNFKPYGAIKNNLTANDYEVHTQEFKVTNTEATKAQYIKVKAHNFGKLPEWHLGKGGEAFIFIDEIEVK